MMIEQLENGHLRLTIPVAEAVFFALGWSAPEVKKEKEWVHQLVGLLAVDALEYSEQWRAASMVGVMLRNKWPELGE